MAAKIGEPRFAVHVEPIGDSAIQPGAGVTADLAVESQALVVAGAWTDAFGGHIAGDLAELLAHEVARQAKRAPIGEAPA